MHKFLTTFIALSTFSALAASDLQQQIHILSDEIQSFKKVSGTSTMSIGGYGEFAYVNKRSEQEDGSKASQSDNPSLDATRFVFFFGKSFNKNWKLNSEIEIEHANEIYLEQATLDYNHSELFNFQVGVMLIPVGLVNLSHEPTEYFAVLRPEVEQKIIPSTWRELGVSVFGSVVGIDYRLSLVDGMDASKFSSDGIRSGRQKASKAEAGDMAFAVRADYSLFSNTLIGISLYYGEANGTRTDVKQTIYDLHLRGKVGDFIFRGLYVGQNIDGAGVLSSELGKVTNESVAKMMNGFYIEGGYDFFSSDEKSLILFVRYEKYDTHADIAGGFTKDKSMDRTNIVAGLNYFPINELVFKFDYTIGKNEAKTGTDSWHLGVGWNF